MAVWSSPGARAADCCVYGRIELGEARLTDLLTVTPELLIRDAHLEIPADGDAVEMSELTVMAMRCPYP
jgi:hypothetical protein